MFCLEWQQNLRKRIQLLKGSEVQVSKQSRLPKDSKALTEMIKLRIKLANLLTRMHLSLTKERSKMLTIPRRKLELWKVKRRKFNIQSQRQRSISSTWLTKISLLVSQQIDMNQAQLSKMMSSYMWRILLTFELKILGVTKRGTIHKGFQICSILRRRLQKKRSINWFLKLLLQFRVQLR